MAEQNRLEILLNKLINGEQVGDWECLNRLEQHLVCILTRSGFDKLGAPMNRLETLLQALYYVVPEGSIEILAARLEEQEDLIYKSDTYKGD